MNNAKFLRTIKLDNFEQILSDCKEFSEKMYDKSMVKKHQKDGSQKTRQQLVDSNVKGKLAEFAVCQYFQELDIDVSLPDLKIYSKYEKSHDGDLFIIRKDGSRLDIAVKSQHIGSIEKFGASGLIMKNSYETQKERELVFVETSDDLTTYKIYRCGKIKDLEKGVTKASYSQNTKIAFYFNLQGV